MSKIPAEITQLLQQKGVSIESSEDENGNGKLPPELNDMLRGYFEGEGAMLMGVAEARKHRESLMQARSAYHVDADDQWHQHTYSFCEH